MKYYREGQRKYSLSPRAVPTDGLQVGGVLVETTKWIALWMDKWVDRWRNKTDRRATSTSSYQDYEEWAQESHLPQEVGTGNCFCLFLLEDENSEYLNWTSLIFSKYWTEFAKENELKWNGRGG